MARSRRTVAAPSRSAPAPAAARPVQQPPQSHAPAPVAAPQPPMMMQQQQPSSGGMLSGIGSTIAQGMAFGTGSAIAHRAVGAASDAIFGGASEKKASPDEIPRQQMVASDPFSTSSVPGPCDQDKTLFFDCLKANKGDQQACTFLYETLQACQRSSTEMRF